MQMYPTAFHNHRLSDPRREAERRIFQKLQHCGVQGLACYEWQRKRRDGQSLQLDFALWLLGTGRFGLQVKGGHYSFTNGEWYRRKGRRGGHVLVTPCLLAITSDATMGLLNEVEHGLGQSASSSPSWYSPTWSPMRQLPTGPSAATYTWSGRRTRFCPVSLRSPGKP